MPRVTVAMTVYNGSAYLGRALDSVFAQTYKDFDVLIVDDGSKDNTVEIASQYPVRVIQQQNMGAGGGRKRLMEEATGELIAILDHDDEWVPEKLERQVPLHDDPSVVLSHHGAIKHLADGSEHEWRQPYTAASTSYDQVAPIDGVIAISALFSRAAMLEAGNFEADVRLCSDWFGWFLLVSKGRFVYLDELLCHYFIRPGQNSEPGLKFFEGERYLIEDKILPRFDALFASDPDREAHRRALLRYLGKNKRTLAHYYRVDKKDRARALRMHRESVGHDPANLGYWLSWAKNALFWRA